MARAQIIPQFHCISYSKSLSVINCFFVSKLYADANCRQSILIDFSPTFDGNRIYYLSGNDRRICVIRQATNEICRIVFADNADALADTF